MASFLSYHVMMLGGGGSERWLGYMGRVLINGLSALIKDPESCLVPSAIWLWEIHGLWTRKWAPTCTDLQVAEPQIFSLQNCEIRISVAYKSSLCGILLWQLEWTDTSLWKMILLFPLFCWWGDRGQDRKGICPTASVTSTGDHGNQWDKKSQPLCP